MEWRDVPGYPGYQVSERGRLRKASGYVLVRRGARYVLFRNGKPTRLTPQELIALAWPPEGEPGGPAQPAPAGAPVASAPVKERGRDIPEGFVPVPGFPGYHINREGICLGRSGRPLQVHRPDGPAGGSYAVGNTSVSVARLLDLAFGTGAAVAAGYPEPKPVEPGRRPRAAVRNFGTHASRRCHDCGRPTNNYRCPACWKRLRGSAVEVEESEWNAL